MFDEFPYTDLHNLNLDWFLEQFKKLVVEFKKLVVEFKKLKEDISIDSSGLTDDVKIALENLLAKVAYIDGNGRTYLDTLHTAMYPPAPPATLTDITCVYTQSGPVYETDSLDDLKSDLVVTASYDNGTTATVTDYMLSGTLAEGTSTITVSYGGKTTTFSVTVTAHVYTRSDYAAQDKMLLWLDGIDNTASGHNASSTIWEDLSGNGYNVTYNDVGIISDDHYNPNGKGCSIVTMNAIRTNIEAGTVEVVMKGTHDSASHVILPFGNTRGACIISSNAKTPPYVCLHPNTEGKCFETTGVVQTFNSLGYVDGVAGNPLTGETGGTWATYMMNLIFCYKNTGSYPANSDVYAIRIYDKELTAEEIALNATVDRSRFGGS